MQFLDAAAETILEKGPDAVTMEGVAAALGVSKGLGYAYFANSDELIQALFDREVANLDAALLAAGAAADDFEGRIRSVLHAFLDVLEERGMLLWKLVLARSSDPGLELAQRERAHALESYVALMMASEFDLDKRTAKLVTIVQLKGVEGAIDAWVRGVADRDAIEEAYITMVMAAVEAMRQQPVPQPRRRRAARA